MNAIASTLKVMQKSPLGHIFDLDKQPIDQLDHPDTQKLITRCRKELDAVGCAVIRNLVLPKSLTRMQAEAERLMDQTYWSADAIIIMSASISAS